jgi:hypothetical protein
LSQVPPRTLILWERCSGRRTLAAAMNTTPFSATSQKRADAAEAHGVKPFVVPAIVALAAMFLAACAKSGWRWDLALSASAGPDRAAAQGHLPYGKPVPGKPGFVFTPYEQYKGYIDVRGFPRGTEFQDPYSQRKFLVP